MNTLKRYTSLIGLVSISTLPLIACDEAGHVEISGESATIEATLDDSLSLDEQVFALMEEGSICTTDNLRDRAKKRVRQQAQRQRGQRRGEHPEGAERPELPEGTEGAQRPERPERPESAERPESNEGETGRRQNPKSRVKKRLIKRAYDVNQDGTLDADERETLQADAVSRCEIRHAQLLDRFDEDGDGTLNEAERDSVREARRQRAETRRANREEHRAELLETYDIDGDGELSEEERQAAQADRQAQREERRAAFESQFDQDGDGVLNEEEEAALQSELRDRFSSGLSIIDRPEQEEE